MDCRGAFLDRLTASENYIPKKPKTKVSQLLSKHALPIEPDVFHGLIQNFNELVGCENREVNWGSSLARFVERSEHHKSSGLSKKFVSTKFWNDLSRFGTRLCKRTSDNLTERNVSERMRQTEKSGMHRDYLCAMEESELEECDKRYIMRKRWVLNVSIQFRSKLEVDRWWAWSPKCDGIMFLVALDASITMFAIQEWKTTALVPSDTYPAMIFIQTRCPVSTGLPINSNEQDLTTYIHHQN